MFAKVPTYNAKNTTDRSILPWTHVNSRLEPSALAEFSGFVRETELCAHANRSLSPFGVKLVIAGYALVSLFVVGFTYLQGNVIAPVFLLINALILAFAGRAVWKGTDSGDYFRVDENALHVCRKRQGRVDQRQLPLERVRLDRDDADCWLEHGTERLRIGEFLNLDQRKRMFEQLDELLRLAKAQLVSKL